MSKSLEKKEVGRPAADIEGYFTKMVPYLNLGLSVYRACNQADVPYTTVRDYYNQDEDFRRRVDLARDDIVVTSRAKLAEEVKKKSWSRTDAHKYVLDNLDEDFSKQKNQGNINIAGNEMSIEFVLDDYATDKTT